MIWNYFYNSSRSETWESSLKNFNAIYIFRNCHAANIIFTCKLKKCTPTNDFIAKNMDKSSCFTSVFLWFLFETYRYFSSAYFFRESFYYLIHTLAMFMSLLTQPLCLFTLLCIYTNQETPIKFQLIER